MCRSGGLESHSRGKGEGDAVEAAIESGTQAMLVIHGAGLPRDDEKAHLMTA